MIRLLVFLYIFGAVASDKESTTVTIGTPSTTLTNLSKVTLIILFPLRDILIFIRGWIISMLYFLLESYKSFWRSYNNNNSRYNDIAKFAKGRRG